ncbi:TetR/AcrR family transcriptional regulator [Companilactobacillus ginsenosidimutans]|uniref:HTH tetR-type domain-containing protein n=1 Tax=Companilactobacillus ginsenosidimutans TaxID=1007676 RepID=A0A0H4QK74_9LACO|nr:helix-turn-helix domain-containing protein [Companilactobacillus ginsenosidimutans]AKP68312.1 hypothetical protein ABM34_12695 [Companilactobacillus ginsenosidimutans]
MTEDKRLKKIFDSACNLFINKGYAETKMKDIAKKASISVGSMYDLFKNKEALLNFVFIATLDNDTLFQDHNFPIENDNQSSIQRKIETTYQRETSVINHNLLEMSSEYSLSSLVNDLFKIFNHYGQYFLILEKNPSLNPILIESYKSYRSELYTNIAVFLKNSIVNKKLRDLDNPEYVAMMIVDLIFWWSTHKKYDSFENGKNDYSVTKMQSSITDLLVKSYSKS